MRSLRMMVCTATSALRKVTFAAVALASSCPYIWPLHDSIASVMAGRSSASLAIVRTEMMPFSMGSSPRAASALAAATIAPQSATAARCALVLPKAARLGDTEPTCCWKRHKRDAGKVGHGDKKIHLTALPVSSQWLQRAFCRHVGHSKCRCRGR
jgi:hypothetical protein